MRAVEPNDAGARQIVERATGTKICEPYSGLVFIDYNNMARIIGAAVFNNYTGRDVHFSCALLKKDIGMLIARRVAYYVFEMMGCHRCTAITAATNVRAIKALEKLGFKAEGVLRQHFKGNIDGIIFGLLRSEQRFLRNLDDKRPISSTNLYSTSAHPARSIQDGRGSAGL